MLIDSYCYSYITGQDDIKSAWEAFNKSFADFGVCRKVSLLQQLVSTKLNDCNSMGDFVNKMTLLWSKKKSVGFKIDEEVATSLMLKGLPNEYKPMI